MFIDVYFLVVFRGFIRISASEVSALVGLGSKNRPWTHPWGAWSRRPWRSTFFDPNPTSALAEPNSFLPRQTGAWNASIFILIKRPARFRRGMGGDCLFSPEKNV
ncbi:hypothetical protein [Marinobacter sp. 2_MG-2023]|uniref:hypothetical protein n=1 Tax=Marinobacter sp. 2_MG-2023 TaxID=3062679 RepID=UPI0026E49681|nr:hypothetical protein [Marinobacter sp. 2_MG-2023]MDO6441933.1 hypothetical protein [Marinobacter sp. 2_MG-2023]